MVIEYSQELYQYLGRIKLKSSQTKEPFERYIVFCNALESLSGEGLSEEDSRLARNILRIKAKETKPWNIGSASAEAGEAD